MRQQKTTISWRWWSLLISLWILIFRFGYNWDCDPLIHIFLWISLLITLILANIFLWAMSMLSALQTHNNVDDPLSPSSRIEKLSERSYCWRKKRADQPNKCSFIRKAVFHFKYVRLSSSVKKLGRLSFSKN